MNSRPIVLLCFSAILLAGCARLSSVDAKKTSTSGKESTASKNTAFQLTDKDIFGNETTLAVTEEDIQAALEEDEFHVPLNSKIILVQSGSSAPETLMQQEMGKYYAVATFSGIPDRQKVISCNKEKDENNEAIIAENMNWMQALRYVAAKGHQKAIIIYQDLLQSGKYDPVARNTLWSDYKNEKVSDTTSMRYLVRFTLVDVATGEWAAWSPVNYEYKVMPPLTDKKISTETIEQQIAQLKQNTYASMVKDLTNRYR